MQYVCIEYGYLNAMRYTKVSVPMLDSDGKTTFVYNRRNLLQEGQNDKKIRTERVKFRKDRALLYLYCRVVL